MNPGSVSIPKNESWHGYMILEDNRFLWKDFNGDLKMEHM
jgi:predicted phosphodiesterase